MQPFGRTPISPVVSPKVFADAQQQPRGLLGDTTDPYQNQNPNELLRQRDQVLGGNVLAGLPNPSENPWTFGLTALARGANQAMAGAQLTAGAKAAQTRIDGERSKLQAANLSSINPQPPKPMGLLGGGAGRDDGGSGIGTRGYGAQPQPVPQPRPQAAPAPVGGPNPWFDAQNQKGMRGIPSPIFSPDRYAAMPIPPPAPVQAPVAAPANAPAPAMSMPGGPADTSMTRADHLQDAHQLAAQNVVEMFTPQQRAVLAQINQSDPGRVQEIITDRMFKQNADGMTPYQKAQQDLEERKFQFAQDKAGQQDPVTQIEHVKAAQGLRKEFAQLSGEYRAISDGYGKVSQGAQLAESGNGAGDLAIVFGVMKMLDPTSVVREGEAASAGQVSGAASQYLNMYNHLVKGGVLPPEARTQLLDLAKNVYGQKSVEQERIKKQFVTISQRGGIAPDEVLMELGSGGPTDQPPGGGASPHPGAKQAPDGHWYLPDPDRPGKFLRVD